jgi:hypothetical protein
MRYAKPCGCFRTRDICIYKTWASSFSSPTHIHKQYSKTPALQPTPGKHNQIPRRTIACSTNFETSPTTATILAVGGTQATAIGRSTLDVPALVTPGPSTDSDYIPSYQSRSSSTGDALKQRSQSTPGEFNRGQHSPVSTSRTSNLASSRPRRKRHEFWKTGLWNSKYSSPSGTRVRASSQSVTLPHPSVVGEQMRNMPHADWRGKNSPDRVWDDENLARLYW